MQTQEQELGLGVLGCGGFGIFALQQFMQVPGVRLAGVAGTSRDEARRVAARFGVDRISSQEELLANPDVDLVYVNTPPFLHAEQVRAALEAGKHVLVEKPLATTVEEGEALLQLAQERGRIVATNLMQRYNPLYQKVAAILASDALGKPLFFSLANHAVDEGLAAEHWFWDREKSGGIFIEHGVHFFDIAEGWFGAAELVSAGSARRDDGSEDQVWCDVRYASGTVGRFYHGFNQSSRTEHQQWDLICERGRIEMQGWIPLAATIRAIVDEASTRRLLEVFPGAQLDVTANYGGARQCRGHGQTYDVYQQVELRWSVGIEKLPLYCQLLRAIFADQLRGLSDAQHERQVTERNGLASLRVAASAARLCQNDR